MYAAHPEYGCLTVLETYTPTRPALDKVRALMEMLRQELGETNPLLRLVQGRPSTDIRLTLYDSLSETAQHLAYVVYEEEGKY